MLTTYASELANPRKILRDRRGNSYTPQEIQQAALDILDPVTEVHLTHVDQQGNYGVPFVISSNSAPQSVYITADELMKNPDYILAESGLKLPWKDQKFIFTRGAEAVRFTVVRAKEHIVVVYERKIVVLPVRILQDSVSVGLVIFSVEITVKLLEIVSLLLEKDCDYAIVGIYTPHTSCRTTNLSSGWFVIETNVSRDVVMKAYAEASMANMNFTNRADVFAYLKSSWRNMVHVRSIDGRQFMIYHPYVRLADRIAKPPLIGAELNETHKYGANYLSFQINNNAMAILDSCAAGAVLQHGQDKEKLGTHPLFFDPQAALRLHELKARLAMIYRERSDSESGIYNLFIDPNLMSEIERSVPKTVRISSDINASDLLKMGKTVADVYTGYMERFIRNFISALYICYGHSKAENQPFALVDVLYRAGLNYIEEKEQAYSLLTNGMDWCIDQINNIRMESQRTNATQRLYSSVLSDYGAILAAKGSMAKFMVFVINKPRISKEGEKHGQFFVDMYPKWIIHKSLLFLKQTPIIAPPAPAKRNAKKKKVQSVPAARPVDRIAILREKIVLLDSPFAENADQIVAQLMTLEDHILNNIMKSTAELRKKCNAAMQSH